MPKQDSPCFFCGSLPCECDGVKKKSTPRARKAAKPKPAPPVDEVDFGTIPERTKPKFKVESESTPERDLSLEAALRVLRPIVCKRDQNWIDKKLARPYPQELDRRISDWRGSHGTKEQDI